MAVFDGERVNPSEYKASGEQWKSELRKSLGEAFSKMDDATLLFRLMQLRMMLEIQKRLEARQYNINDALRK